MSNTTLSFQAILKQTHMDQKKKNFTSRLDVIVNKSNLASARFRKIQQPWMLAPDDNTNVDEDVDDLAQFQGESELTGLNSKVATGEDDALAILQRTRTSTKDRLLEQLLGKQGAQAHLKKQQSQKQAPVKVAPSKNVVSSAPAQNKEESSDGESEGGRAATILRKASTHTVKAIKASTSAQDEDLSAKDDLEKGEVDMKGDQSTLVHNKGKTSSSKRKAHSYLDELLSKRSKKNRRNG